MNGTGLKERPSERRDGMTPHDYSKSGLQTLFGRIRADNKCKKTMVSNATGEKQGSGAGGATEASSPEKKATGAKQQDTQTEANDELWEVARLAPRHRTQLADGGRWCDGKKQRAPERNRLFWCVGEGAPAEGSHSESHFEEVTNDC